MTTDTAHVRFVDELPPSAVGKSWGTVPHALIAAALKEQPGRWAMLPDFSIGNSAVIRGGTVGVYRPAGSFESIIRDGAVYARYVG